MVPDPAAARNNPLPQSVVVETPHCRGAVIEAMAPAVAELFALPAAEWLAPAGGGLAVIKQSTVRTVASGAFGGALCHVKLFRQGRLSDRARDALLGAQAERELGNLLAARAAGLPAVEPVAAGRFANGDGPRSFLITRTVPDARPFRFDLPADVQRRAGGLLRAAHDLGVLPRDLHTGNLLIAGDGMPWLVDLTSVHRGRDPDLAARAAALAFFCLPLDGGATDARARELLAGYQARGAMPERFAVELRKAHVRQRLHALDAFGRRSSRTCRHTIAGAKVRGQDRWFLHLSGEQESDRELHAACSGFAAATPEPTRSGRRGPRWLLPGLVVKQRERADSKHLFRASYWLLFAGVPAAPAVALRLCKDHGQVFWRRLGNRDLAAELKDGLPAAAVRAAARELGAAVGRLHAHGLRNRDLKFENLVRDPATNVVAMVDLDGVRHKNPSDRRGQGRDLGRLLAAFEAAGSPGGVDTLRTFLRSYLRARHRLLQPADRAKVLRIAERRAREWRSAHRDA